MNTYAYPIYVWKRDPDTLELKKELLSVCQRLEQAQRMADRKNQNLSAKEVRQGVEYVAGQRVLFHQMVD